jgi:peroxiredoxin
MKDFFELPTNLPVPQDDGACHHLLNLEIPTLILPSTQGRDLNLKECAQNPVVFFFYPRTGEPDVSTPEGWDDIPGARGCTPQSCGFRDLHAEFKECGFQVFGISAQTIKFQQEFVSRMHIPFEILSDCQYLLTDALNLPTFEFAGERLIKRMAWVIDAGKIIKVFYPVFPPGQNAQAVLNWLKKRNL